VALQAYRGYGSREEVFLLGRVFFQPEAGAGAGAGPIRHDAVNVARRLLRRGAAGAELIARFGGTEQRLTTDRDGYLRVHMRLERPPSPGRLWHPLELELLAPAKVTTRGEVFIPPDTCRFVVVSDIDDTVIHTGVANKLQMLWRFTTRGARGPTVVPGIASLYRALHRGASGDEGNPLLYVSRGPWAIYELLDEFFNANGIPVGPILFLREWGISPSRPFPRRARAHKLTVIRKMLDLYRDLPFVLIGDSGEGDPEIYASLVRERRDRVLAIYIRDVGRDPARSGAIAALAREVAAAGSSLLLASDSAAMATHAAARGLIAPADDRGAGETDDARGMGDALASSSPAPGGQPS
jgi:phosphatidate phosphatase APP1